MIVIWRERMEYKGKIFELGPFLSVAVSYNGSRQRGSDFMYQTEVKTASSYKRVEFKDEIRATEWAEEQINNYYRMMKDLVL